MTKQEFLDELKQALSGQVSSEVLMDTYRYYANYMEEEMKRGKSEDQVLDELGRPALIARSVIAAQTGDRVADVEYTEDGRTRRIYHNTGHKDREEKKEKKTESNRSFVFRLDSWYVRLLFALVFLLLVGIVFVFLKGLFFVFFRFGIPLLLFLGVLYLLLYALR
ncbi:MAG: DUF1700 domain-containing protein [Lachnospiraceae bacterium]|nr:DUF1700 domain-containing protein [Lachnospiraceae bacterium]